jgi:hypothetical protein
MRAQLCSFFGDPILVSQRVLGWKKKSEENGEKNPIIDKARYSMPDFKD